MNSIENIEKSLNSDNLTEDELTDLRFDIEDLLDQYQTEILDIVGRGPVILDITISKELNNNLYRANQAYTKLMKKIEL